VRRRRSPWQAQRCGWRILAAFRARPNPWHNKTVGPLPQRVYSVVVLLYGFAPNLWALAALAVVAAWAIACSIRPIMRSCRPASGRPGSAAAYGTHNLGGSLGWAAAPVAVLSDWGIHFTVSKATALGRRVREAQRRHENPVAAILDDRLGGLLPGDLGRDLVCEYCRDRRKMRFTYFPTLPCNFSTNCSIRRSAAPVMALTTPPNTFGSTPSI
jgi:hypothetical protein